VPAATVEIRPLRTLEELRACVTLQQEIWGAEFDEIVPASLMLAALHLDALALGAFGADQELIGFVFGLTGLKDGEVVHWSHMLGVRPGARDQGIGRRLKEVQRDLLSGRGIQRMYWTFDPLQARNAHLNINGLGARVIEYVADMYGASQSPLHHDLPTDRLVVECLTTPEVEPPPGRTREDRVVPVLTPFPQFDDVAVDGGSPQTVLIEVPWDLEESIESGGSSVRDWRVATRLHFQWAFAQAYTVIGFLRDTRAHRVFYVMERARGAS
jgi:predicted GNAT superfamily acetyltransferase